MKGCRLTPRLGRALAGRAQDCDRHQPGAPHPAHHEGPPGQLRCSQFAMRRAGVAGAGAAQQAPKGQQAHAAELEWAPLLYGTAPLTRAEEQELERQLRQDVIDEATAAIEIQAHVWFNAHLLPPQIQEAFRTGVPIDAAPARSGAESVHHGPGGAHGSKDFDEGENS